MAIYPLQGIRVLDFGTTLAMPVAMTILADMGAEVIKVETRTALDGGRRGRPPGASRDAPEAEQRKWPDMVALFPVQNRNKLSITINLKHPKATALLARLVKISDVVADNSGPGVMKRLGADYDTLKKIKPDIICCSMSGVGQNGPTNDAVIYSISTQALGGLTGMTGYYDEPTLRGIGGGAHSYGDNNACISSIFGILAALYYRKRTGEGQYIDLAETEGVTSLLGETILDYTMNRRVARPQGSNNPSMAPHNFYRCKGDDRWVSIAIKTEEEWASFCQAIGNPAWTKEPRFADVFNRLDNLVELDKLVTAWTVNYTPNEAMEILQKAGVAAMVDMNATDRYADPHFKAREYGVEIEHPLLGMGLLPGVRHRLSKTPGAVLRSAPLLGGHNEYVFKQLCGLSQEEFDQLDKEGVLE